MSSVNVVIVDQDNVRASAGWPNAKDFRERVLTWARSSAAGDPTVIVEVDEKTHKKPCSSSIAAGSSCDHRQRARPIGERTIANFLGPKWRADDGIVRDAEWWLRRPETASVLVISSDKQVRRRCSEVKQRVNNIATSAPKLRFETNEAFAMLLPAMPHASTASTASTVAPTTRPPAVTLQTGALAEFAQWITEEQPGPLFTASDIVHAGERARLAKIGKPKRKLGVKR